ncbi:Tetratricopeptide repeat (TPR)-like superfamily protein [Raphanus sativus]|uniref:Pentatricopeptide repeat-containing protein At1g74600, chloroplastic n=1 Tax=Raphanus sativus TaxID=3726 RepID=A0A6J0NI80_RAPSA|nr:pentatricopeptide repeat-containing protein At1g74600, chloroplastic [Raphanus sativus]KAJ4916489.1 Tetratricopeptide repeat (TPR)-like superfamily protein [Raphanus sativus]
MRGAQALNFLRRTTTLAPQHIRSTAAATRLEFGSCLEENPSDLVYTHNRKIDDLLKSGDLISAHEVFDGMSLRDVVTYNLMISGNSRNGCSVRAFELYGEMVSHGLRESASTFPSVLSVCSSDEWLCREGIQVHCRVISLGFECNTFVRSALVGLYASLRLVDVALKLFDEMPERNLAVCNLMLRWFCESGDSKGLFGVYRRMGAEGVDENGLSYCYMIRGCSKDRLLCEGKQLHSLVVKSGWNVCNIFVANTLVDFYSACGDLYGSKTSFDDVPEQDVISWNSIVSVCADHGSVLESLDLFRKMQFWGKRPSVRSFMSFLNFCSRNSYIQSGKQIHCYVLKMGFDVSSLYVQSALIDMYGKCNDIESSVSVYRSLPGLTLECCNSLMTSLMHCGITKDIIEMFGLMIDEGTGIDEVTLSTVLKALSLSEAVTSHSCTLVHCCAIKSGYASDAAVSCSLIDTYSKSGQNEVSRKVFDELDSPNIFCWTSIINGYGRNGMGRDCVETLKEMDRKNLTPDEVTILSVLSGCSHSGLVEEGELIFNSLESNYGIVPGRKLYACMVDLLGRAGLVQKAEKLLLKARGDADCIAWSSLLQSCRIHGNEAIGRRAAEALMDLEPDNFAVYIQVSKFYFEIGDFEISRRIREIAASRELMREIGYSSVIVRN